jgi:hypothetical protein
MKKLIFLVLFLLPQTISAYVITFDENYDLSSWTPDRFKPYSVQTEEFDGGSRLKINISGGEEQKETYYNYQGIKHEFGDNIYSSSIVGDLFVGDWSQGLWNVGIWGVLKDNSDQVAGYPIISYRNSETIDAGFYCFDYIDGGWLPMLSIADFNQWYNLKMVYDLDSVDYYINNSLVYSFQDTYPKAVVSNIILNSYNFGSTYDVFWDNVGTLELVPEPSTIILLGIGLLVTAFFGKKISLKIS